ncbi:MAG: Ig-like domain-containing protein, partial [Pseudomonadales bacterium]|nr:Ig-like domain-containing protein [Pseudomonadales bacterium]
MRSLLFLVLTIFVVPAVFAQDNNKDINHCDVYPLTVTAQLFAGKEVGFPFTSVQLGEGYGSFNWLSWKGNSDTKSLAESLRFPGNSDQFLNPRNSNDHVLSEGDWVYGVPGVKSGKSIRDALDDLLNQEIVIPVFGKAEGVGKLRQFQVAGFAKIKITGYKLGGKGHLSLVFGGMEHCNNLPPIAEDVNYTLLEDSSLDFTLGVSDANQESLDFELVTYPENGLLQGSLPDLTYVPRSNFNGTDRMTFIAKDSTSSSEPADVVFTVSPVNDLPVVSDTELEVYEDSKLNVLIDASDIDGDPLSFSIASDPDNGALKLEEGRIIFLPDEDFYGQEAFEIFVSDGFEEVTVLYSLNVLAVNDPPSLEGKVFSINEDGTLQTELKAVDPDGDDLDYVIAEEPEHGSVFLQGSSLTYTPSENFHGSDSFSILVRDGEVATQANFSVQVASVNDAPTAEDVSVKLFVGDTVLTTLEASDPDGQLVEHILLGSTSLGSLEIKGDRLGFTANVAGEERVLYRVVDDEGAYTDASILLLVEKSNNSPVINSDPVAQGKEGEPYHYLPSAEDPDGDAISWSLEEFPDGMTINAQSGEVAWQSPTPGLHEVQLLAEDGSGGQDYQRYKVLITSSSIDRSAGKLHWFMFNANQDGARDLYLTISTEESSSYEVSVPSLDFYVTGIAEAGRAEVVDLSELSGALTHDYSGVSDLGIKVVSSKPARVSAYNLAIFSSDSFHVYPVSSWGKEYLLATFPGGSGALYGVVAGEDATSVTVTSDEGDVVETFSLDKGQAYQSIFEDGGDPSGFVVTANKPVAVFAGNRCTSVYRAACDHLVEQLRPLSQLGSEYVLIPFAMREGGDYLRVYGAFDNTLVYLNGVLVSEINKGEAFSEVIDQPTVITSSHPVTAIQYAIGTNYDSTYNSDPLMLLLQPVGLNGSSRSHNYFYPPLSLHGGDITHHMTLMKKTSGAGSLSLNGALLDDSKWSVIKGTDYSFYKQRVESGYHHIDSDFDFSSYSYAHAYFTSYGHVQNGVDGRYISPEIIFIDQPGSASVGQELCLNIYL